ncbi:alpha-glucosidase C-terminal domain-containing protein [Candidatus Fermentibacteria bacterium]|nr:alpha-glucosidase C-terminal domain-containing protein [Candidatus Fermentibacteria bacterium]
MRALLIPLLLLTAVPLHASDVEVHFRFPFQVGPPDVATGMLGSMNSWGLPPDGSYLVFEDDDQDNIWRGSMTLEEGTYFYKFVSLSSTEPTPDASYPDVTGWYPDPLNSLTDGSAYNNSVLNIVDPMIYYVLPLDSSLVEDTRPLLSANFAAGVQTGLDVTSLSMKLDGVDITASADFDTETGCLSYLPGSDLAMGWHTLELSGANNAGASVSAVSRFQMGQGPPRMYMRFALDTQSPNFGIPLPIDRVQITGDFSNWGASPARFQDPEDDGVWEASIRMEIGRNFLYRFIANGTLYLPDPDNPAMELRNPGDWYVSVGRANPLGPPRILDLSLVQGRIIPPDQQGPPVEFGVVPGDWGTALVPDSLSVTLDGLLQQVTPDQSGDTLFASFLLPLCEPGLHTVVVRAVDEFGRVGTDTFSFGAYGSGSGFHAVDSFGDDDGPGRYRYPAGVTPGAADIKAFHVGTSTRLDPVTLQAIVEMAAVNQHTALGLVIASSLDGPAMPLPGDIDVMGPPWQDQGVFIWLVPPSSPYYDDAIDNRLILGTDPFIVGAAVGINSDPETAGSFIVSLPLEELESHLGTYTGSWFWGLVATLRTDDGVELEPAQGGWLAQEDPDVYDATFFAVPSSEQRILGSWIEAGMVGGPREVALVNTGRGLVALHPDSIQGLPQTGPEVLFYSAGAARIWRDFTVTGMVADPEVTTGQFMHNRSTWPITITNGTCAVPITMTNGANYVGLDVTDASGNRSVTWSRYDCRPDLCPKARIAVGCTPGAVTLDGAGSYHPDNGIIASFSWSEEPGNPAALNLSGTSSIQASFTLPKPPGEYAVRLTVDDEERTGSSVATIRIDSTGAVPLLPAQHPRWAGDNLMYEIYPVSYSSTRDLAAITADMERIRGLGVKTLWMTPIFASPEAHGYAITDYFNLNPSMGDSTALAQLIAAAHSLGIKVILDQVINHTSLQHPFMIDALRYGENSIYRDYYLWNTDGSYQNYWADLPNLNYGNSEVWDYSIRASQFWVEQYDIDGYRCDVAWGIQERTPAFWQAWRDSLKVTKDNVLLLAEASTEDASLFDGRFDAAYDWGYMNHLKGLMRGVETPSALHGHVMAFPGMGEGPLALRFIENHDETRFVAEFGPARTKAAAAILYASPGLPLLYAGQEVGELTQRYYIDWSDPHNLQPFYHALGAIREAITCLRHGAYRGITNTNPSNVYCFARDTADQRVFVAANCRAFAQAAELALPVELWGLDPGEDWVVSDLLTGETQVQTTEGLQALSLVLDPYQVMIVAVADSAVVGAFPEPQPAVLRLALAPPIPNPTRGTTTVSFSLPRPGAPALELWDLAGHRRARIDMDETVAAGTHTVTWNLAGANGPGPGAYVVVLHADGERRGRPLIVLP